MSKLVIVGGSNGLGRAFLELLAEKYNECVVFDVYQLKTKRKNVKFFKCDISKNVESCIEEIKNADTLIITAGIGLVKRFGDISYQEIEKIIKVNTLSTIKILSAFYPSLASGENKMALVCGSIAGEVSSPLFSVYGASKAAINKFCESVNIELEMSSVENRITCVIASSIEGTSFNGQKTDILKLKDIALNCIEAMYAKKPCLYINEQLCIDIVNRYNSDKHGFGISSYEYKINNKRLTDKKMIVVGYLSGTFDLFHIGHLNLLRRAKEQCDYLIVGVHKNGAWKGKETFIPFEERIEIIKACKYVDEAHESLDEDSDAWHVYHYDKLFVGSDYQGTERFRKYELFFENKNVEIVYFPYTKGTSSTELRKRLTSSK